MRHKMPTPKPSKGDGNAADMGDDILLGRVDLKPRLDASNVSPGPLVV